MEESDTKVNVQSAEGIIARVIETGEKNGIPWVTEPVDFEEKHREKKSSRLGVVGKVS